MTGHLIHVGYPKTGSTFLQQWFALHPQLAYVHGGIAGFRSVYDIARAGAMPRGDVRYRVTSDEVLSTPHPYAGTIYVDHREWEHHEVVPAQDAACRMLASLFPDAVVLLVTRGFRAMIFSAYSQYVRTGGDADLAAMLRGDAPLSDPWHYDRIIAMYRGAFGDARVLVMPYELLRDAPERFIRTLEERLGLDHADAPPERVNPALSGEELYWYPRIRRTAATLPSSRLQRLLTRASFENRLRVPIRILQMLRRGRPVTIDVISDEVLAHFRGRTGLLRDDPLYAPYRAEYLMESP